MKKVDFLILKILLLLVFAAEFSYAQTPRVWFSETEIEFTLERDKKIYHTLEFASRGLLRESLNGQKTSGYQHEFVELTYAPVYKITENKEFSFGIRYRWSNTFDASEVNEIRLIPEYSFSHLAGNFELSHTGRVEQRFEGSQYTFRPRYEAEISRDLSSIFSAEISTEALWSISPQTKPELEQRFALEIENASIKNIEMIIGFEFRLEDYTNELEHEFFILSGANIQL